MPKVGIIMGSDSDLKVMSKAAVMLEELGIEYEMTIISAHREPDELIEWTRGAEDRGIKVMIAGAGMAAALPGMCAASIRAAVRSAWRCNQFGCFRSGCLRCCSR